MPLQTESTTFTKDVVGRYTCNTWEEATLDQQDIDVVVLGSGIYGGYCASKIYELSKIKGLGPLRVLVLEAGPFVTHTHPQNIPGLNFYGPDVTDVGSGSDPGIRNEVWGVGWRSNQKFVGQAYCVGGKGLFWGGWCPRLQPSDLSQWPQEVSTYLTTVNSKRPVGFRPISHIDLVTELPLLKDAPLSAYEALEYEIGVLPADDFVFDPVDLSEGSTQMIGLNKALRVFINNNKAAIDPRITQVLPGPVAVQTQSFVSGLFSLDKYSSVPALIQAIRDDHANGKEKDLRMAVVPNCHVVRLDFRPDAESPQLGTRIIDRVVVNYRGKVETLTIAPHCQVVLAMSAIESTRLALESFSLVDSGLRAPNDELMGRNHMFHVRFDMPFDVDRQRFSDWVRQQWPGYQLADVLQQALVHIQCEGPNGRYQYQFYAATNANGPDPNMYQMVPDVDIQRQIADQFQSDKIRIVLRASGEVKGGKNSPLGDPNYDFIDLAKDADYDRQFNHRRAWVQFNNGDHANDPIWQDMYDTAMNMATYLSGASAPIFRRDKHGKSDYSLKALKNQQGVGTTYHESGTLWMGDHPDSSVTDVNGHFHHVTNAYCADQALFTTVGSANPVLTGLCLARKIASDVIDRHSGYTEPSSLPGLQAVSLLPNNGWLTAPYNGMKIIDQTNNGLIETNPQGPIGLYFLPEDCRDF